MLKMSFRCGSSVKLLVIDLRNKERYIVNLGRPTLFDLKVALSSYNSTEHTKLFVKRNEKIFVITCDRCVEELGGYTSEEIMYLETDTSTRTTIDLCKYQMSRDELPVTIQPKLKSDLRKNGYLIISLSESDYNVFHCFVEAMKDFTSNCPDSYKNTYGIRSIGGMSTQPEFGYRKTNLQKEYFVCRDLTKLQSGKTSILKYPSKHFEECAMNYINAMKSITKKLLRSILISLSIKEEYLEEVLNHCGNSADSLNTLGFASMSEIFRYDCKGYIPSSDSGGGGGGEGNLRMPCGDHVDVSLLTVIPKCIGTPGLEVFDWEQGWISIEKELKTNECVVMAGEMLNRLTCGNVTPTSHRVVIETDSNNERYSAVYELLPDPSYLIDCVKLFGASVSQEQYKIVETSCDYISRISQNLVSVNK